MSETELLGEGSSINLDPAPDLYTRLYALVKYKDFEGFRRYALDSSEVDFNHVYKGGTLMDIACNTTSCGDFVQFPVLQGADPNKTRPLHGAVEFSDLETLQHLLDCPRTDVNILDNTGNTALHTACRLGKLDQAKLLLGHPKIRVNVLNKENQAPIQVAIVAQNENVVSELLKHKDIDVDTIKEPSGRIIRELIIDKMPVLIPNLPKEDNLSTLFSYLRQNDLNLFTKLLEDDLQLINSNEGSSTFLQYACEHGLHKFVQQLIRLEVDVNLTCVNNNKTGLTHACEKGYFEIIQLLLEKDEISLESIDGGTILHTLVTNSTRENASFLGAAKEGRNYLESIKVVIEKALPFRININQGDIEGNTVLHLAAKTGNQEIIFLLLDHGASIGVKNKSKKPPLRFISPEILEAYFDKCITTKASPKADSYEIKFNYHFLALPKQSDRYQKIRNTLIELESNTSKKVVLFDTELLLYMSKTSELRPLLIHPVMASFVHLTWYSVRMFFYYNMGFICLFLQMLSWYIFVFYNFSESEKEGLLEYLIDNVTLVKYFFENYEVIKYIMMGILFILTVLQFLRKWLHFCISPFRFIETLENWLELFLVILSGIIIKQDYSKKYFLKNQISAVGILLSWVEFILLMGRHISVSKYVETFKTVAKKFLEFLVWYSILILAFALSFYSLFKDSIIVNSNNETSADFNNPASAVLKIFVMSTGEIDYDSFPFHLSPGTSHVLFVLFVFLGTIVFYNLLNGLAVSDVQAIQSDAELLGYVSEIELISLVESMALGNPIAIHDFLAYVKSFCCCVPIRFLMEKTRFFTERNSSPDSTCDYEIRIFPNQDNRVDLKHLGRWNEWYDKLTDTKLTSFAKCRISMKKSIVRSAIEILRRREDDLERERREKKLECHNNQLVAVTLESQKLLHEILSALKKKEEKVSDSDLG